MEISIPLATLSILFCGFDSDKARRMVADDFMQLPLFLSEDAGEPSAEFLNVEIKGDSLVFSDISLLAAAIVNVINAYGLFRYDSVAEFFRTNNSGTEEDAVLYHLRCFSSIEKIYGETLFSPILYARRLQS